MELYVKIKYDGRSKLDDEVLADSLIVAFPKRIREIRIRDKLDALQEVSD